MSSIDLTKLTKDELQSAFNSECALLGQNVIRMDKLIAEGNQHRANLAAIEKANFDMTNMKPTPESK